MSTASTAPQAPTSLRRRARKSLARNFIKGARPPEDRSELRWRHRRTVEGAFAVREGVDPASLTEAGWGILFAGHGSRPGSGHAWTRSKSCWTCAAARPGRATGSTPASARSGQANRRPRSWRATAWAPVPADPDKAPYYLMLVGDTVTIPYKFQYQLDVPYAVGRIHFDTLDEYADTRTA